VAKNLYDVLEVSQTASPSTIDILFGQLTQRLQSEVDAGKPDAKDRLWAVKQAYATLSNPESRLAYDKGLQTPTAPRQRAPVIAPPREGLNWKWNVLFLGLLMAGLIGYGLKLGRDQTKDSHKVEVLKTTRTSDTADTRAHTERVLVEGVVKNDATLIDRSAEVANRRIDVARDAEMRRRQQVEYQAAANQQRIDLARERQSRQLAMQEQSADQQRKRAEEQRLAREKQYWACMNAALDKMSSSAASASCARFL
jgi:curved DNA-binding protein CbpA